MTEDGAIVADGEARDAASRYGEGTGTHMGMARDATGRYWRHWHVVLRRLCPSSRGRIAWSRLCGRVEAQLSGATPLAH